MFGEIVLVKPLNVERRVFAIPRGVTLGSWASPGSQAQHNPVFVMHNDSLHPKPIDQTFNVKNATAIYVSPPDKEPSGEAANSALGHRMNNDDSDKLWLHGCEMRQKLKIRFLIGENHSDCTMPMMEFGRLKTWSSPCSFE
jgi:hypothetical protein